MPFYRRDIRISKKGYGDIHVDEHDRLSNITLIVLYCSTFQCFISFKIFVHEDIFFNIKRFFLVFFKYLYDTIECRSFSESY